MTIRAASPQRRLAPDPARDNGNRRSLHQRDASTLRPLYRGSEAYMAVS
jgi:hypothetical protein